MFKLKTVSIFSIELYIDTNNYFFIATQVIVSPQKCKHALINVWSNLGNVLNKAWTYMN